MVRSAAKPSFWDAACWRVDVENGGGGRRRTSLFSTLETLNVPAFSAWVTLSTSSGPRRVVVFTRYCSENRSYVRVDSTFSPFHDESHASKAGGEPAFSS